MDTATVAPQKTRQGTPMAMTEFVLLIASLMALAALGIDSMLPALPAIGTSLGVANENSRQFVISAFLGGLGIAQLVHGPLADRFGRRTLLIVMLAVYVATNVLAAISTSFVLLLCARAASGAAVAATRVACVAMVRDRYEGTAMARVMSIAFMVFMVVPVLAPTFGAGVLLFGTWRAIFWTIAVVAALVLTWLWIRMPETMHREDRQPLSIARIAAGWRQTLADRASLGYTLAAASMMSAVYGYLNSIQQIVAQVFAKPTMLVVIFAVTAFTMAMANLFNARLVMRLGTRLISHAALCLLIAVGAVHLVVAWTGHETIVTFAILQAISLGAVGLANANFSSMAMQNMGHIAGTASSVQGFMGVTIGTIVGAIVGQMFDGSTIPLAFGVLGAGIVGLAIVAITERGRLFGRG